MAKNLTIHFENASAMCLYYMEMEGQISDGKYENSRPFDHWKWVCDVDNCVVDGKSGIEGRSYYRYTRWTDNYYTKRYNLNEWFSKYINAWRKKCENRNMWATRIIAFSKFGKIYPEITYKTLCSLCEIRIFLEELQMLIEKGEKNPEVLFNKVTDFSTCEWRQKYYETSKDYFTLDFVKKFLELNYDIKECKVDVKSMEESINKELL